MENSRVLIIGGGTGGLCAAIALRDKGFGSTAARDRPGSLPIAMPRAFSDQSEMLQTWFYEQLYPIKLNQ